MAGTRPPEGDLRRYLEPYWRRRWLVLAILVLIPAAVYGASKLATKKYESTTTLLVQATNVPGSLFSNTITSSASSVQDAARLVTTTAVARQAAQELGEPKSSGGSLLGSVRVNVESGTSGASSSYMDITATASNAQRAADVANAFAAAISTTRTGDSLANIDGTITTLRKQEAQIPPSDQAARDQLTSQLQQLEGLRASQERTTQVIEPAAPASAPVSPKPLRNTALGFVLALLVAAGVVPLADALARKLRDPEELEPLLHASLLAQIPKTAFPGHDPSPEVVESFQTLRAALRYFNLDRDLKSILIASPGRGEGKTTVATNLATSLARDGLDVILVDGDLRKPQAAGRLGTDSPGLEAVLGDDAGVPEALAEVPVDGGRLRVLGASKPAPAPAILMGSQRMRSLLSELSQMGDIVIVDTPPLLAVSDAIPLMKEASGVVVLGRINQTHTGALARSREVIESAGGTILGAVATGTRSGGLYGYGGGGYQAYGSELSTLPVPEAAKTNGTPAGISQGGSSQETPDGIRPPG